MNKKPISHISTSIATILVFIITLSLIPLEIFAQTQADFSGTWKLDISKSTELPGMLSATLIIKQQGNYITIKRTFERKNGDPVMSTFDYTIGNHNEYSTKTGITTVSASWSPDKQTFSIIETVVSEKFGTEREVKRTTVYSLTNEGKTLSIIADDTVPRESPELENKRHMEFYYERS